MKKISHGGNIYKKAKEMGKVSDVLDRKIAEGTYIEEEEVKNE